MNLPRIKPHSVTRGSFISASRPRKLLQRIAAQRHKRGGPGTELARLLTEYGITLTPAARSGKTGCATCDDLARRMNRLGAKGCMEQFHALVEEIMPRAQEWWQTTGYLKKGAVLLFSRQPAICKLAAAGRMATGQLRQFGMLIVAPASAGSDHVDNELRLQLARLLADAIAIAADQEEQRKRKALQQEPGLEQLTAEAAGTKDANPVIPLDDEELNKF